MLFRPQYRGRPPNRGSTPQFTGEWLLQLFEGQYDGVRRFVYYLTGDTRIASATAERVFIRLWSFREKVAQSRVVPMLYTLAQKIAQKRHGDKPINLIFSSSIDISPEGNQSKGGFDAPKNLEHFGKVVSSIPDLSRVTLMMNKIDGLPLHEIARRLSFSDAVIERKRGHAVKSLTEALGPESVESIRSKALPSFPILKDESRKLLIETIEQTHSKARQRIRLGLSAALAILFIIIGSSMLEWQYATETVKAKPGKQTIKLLPDSSIVILEPGSMIKMKRYRWDTNRWVDLKGDATFIVKEKETVFLVDAGDLGVQSYSGQFYVSYRHPNLNVESSKGAVSVDLNHPNPITLLPGMAIKAISEYDETSDEEAAPATITEWIGVERYYNHTPLSTVICDIELHFDTRISTQGFNADSLYFTGFTDLSNLSTTLNVVCNSHGLSYSTDEQMGEITIRKPKD